MAHSCWKPSRAKVFKINYCARMKQRKHYLIALVVNSLVGGLYLFLMYSLRVKVDSHWTNMSGSAYNTLVFFGPAVSLVMILFEKMLDLDVCDYNGRSSRTPVVKPLSYVVSLMPAFYWFYECFDTSIFLSVVLAPVSVIIFGLLYAGYNIPASAGSGYHGGSLNAADIFSAKQTMQMAGVNPKYMTCMPCSDIMRMSASEWVNVKYTMRRAGIDISK